jgi:hypothetical protein
MDKWENFTKFNPSINMPPQNKTRVFILKERLNFPFDFDLFFEK